MYEPSPIEIVAPAPKRRFSSPAEALAYYDLFGVQSHEDLIVLAELARDEFAKIHKIFDDVFAKMEAEQQAQQAELAAQE